MDALQKSIYAWVNGLLVVTMGLMWLVIWFVHILQLQVSWLAELVVAGLIVLLSYGFKWTYQQYSLVAFILWILIASLISWVVATVLSTPMLIYVGNLWGWFAIVMTVMWIYNWLHHWQHPTVDQIYVPVGLLVFLFVALEVMWWLGWIHLIVGFFLMLYVIMWWATLQNQLPNWVTLSDDMLVMPAVFSCIMHSFLLTPSQLEHWVDGTSDSK